MQGDFAANPVNFLIAADIEERTPAFSAELAMRAKERRWLAA